jgi:N-acetyl-alpha-D-muramate 1-phosphate uridylyltransferase
MKAMILAAGLGTRLQNLTSNTPKALVEVTGKPMLEIILDKIISQGFNDIVINIHHYGDQIINFLENNKFDAKISISDEREMLLNTGGGIKYAENFLKDSEAFLIHNVDIYSEIDLADMYNKHLENESLVSLAVRKRESTNYFLFDESDQLCGWKSYKTNSEIIARKKESYNEMAFSGIHVVSPKIFDLFTRTGSFSIVNEYLDLAKNHSIKAYVHNDKDILDLGKPEAIEYYEKNIAKK